MVMDMAHDRASKLRVLNECWKILYTMNIQEPSSFHKTPGGKILRMDCGLDEKLNFCAYSPPHISCCTTSPALFIGATNFGHLRTPTPENCQISERKVTKKSPKVILIHADSCPHIVEPCRILTYYILQPSVLLLQLQGNTTHRTLLNAWRWI